MNTPEKDYTCKGWLAVTALIAVLVAVSFIPPRTLGGIKLRRANILSDLISFDDAEAAEQPAATPDQPANQPTSGKAAGEPALVGAYSDYQVLDPEHRDVFSAATRGTKAQNLRPQSVAIQVVNGLNYKYLCTSEDGRTRYAVVIHRPLPHSGEPSSLVSVDELPAE